jgi:transcription initiation factor TFIIF subunit alpha
LKVGKKRIRHAVGGGVGSASDVDGGAGSGGDMSEGGKNKKLKLNPAVALSQNDTPQGSRPGSPAPVYVEGGGATKGKRPAVILLLWLVSEMLQLLSQ